MPKGQIKHANLTVTDPRRSADLFEALCGCTNAGAARR